MMTMTMILASLLGCELPNHLHNHFRAPSFSRTWWLWKGLDPRFPGVHMLLHHGTPTHTVRVYQTLHMYVSMHTVHPSLLTT
jgi:hypothetical protein